MEKEELKLAFKELSLNDKRNIYNEEILKLFEIFRTYFNAEQLISSQELYNYNVYNDEFLDEEKLLEKEYLNILCLREVILTSVTKKDH